MDHKEDISVLYDKYYGNKKDKPISNSKKGYKFCPCGEYIPARSKICQYCNKVFEVGEVYIPPKILTDEEQEEKEYIDKVRVPGKIIYIPRGSCPIRPKLTREGILEWCSLLLSYGQVNKEIYYTTVFKYWLNQLYPDKYLKYRKYIDEWVKEL